MDESMKKAIAEVKRVSEATQKEPEKRFRCKFTKRERNLTVEGARKCDTMGIKVPRPEDYEDGKYKCIKEHIYCEGLKQDREACPHWS